MPQKYKVFFNHNKLFVAKKTIPNIDFKNTFINPDKQVLKSLITFLMKDEAGENYLIITDNLKKTWNDSALFLR